METNYSRGNRIFMTFLSVLFATASLNALTSYVLFHSNPTGSVAFNHVKDLTENKELRSDQANIVITISANFLSEFDWNCNQLYVYVVAEYSTKKKDTNQIVLWDEIIKTSDEAVIEKKTIMNEYPLRDQFKSLLKGATVTLKLYYRRMPIFGFMHTKFLAESDSFVLPEKYFRS